MQSYNADPGLGPHKKMQLFDQARVEYWFKDVCLVFANHLAVSAVKDKQEVEDADTANLAIDNIAPLRIWSLL